MSKILITGGAGFIGHHAVEYFLEQGHRIVILDRLDCSGNLNNLVSMKNWERRKSNVSWVWHDLKAPINLETARLIGKVDVILHLAASSHVDRSIADPLSFVYDNVVGTCNILDFARQLDSLKRMIYFSTDEVFGPCVDNESKGNREWDAYHSSNPYAATKAGAEELALAYHNTYQLPILITHTMNVFGPRQHPEKFIPSTVRKIKAGETVIIHSDKTKTISGSRSYIHAGNVANALDFVLHNGDVGEKYNIVGEREISNLDLAKTIAGYLKCELKYEMLDFHSSRPGHDLRYALDGSLMEGLGWEPPMSFEHSLWETIMWYSRQ